MPADLFDQLMHSGYINQHENDLDSAFFCFDEALKLAVFEKERVEASVCIATVLVMDGDFQSALDLLHGLSSSDQVAEITINHLKANCLHSMKQFEHAKKAYMKALSACSHLPHGNWISEQIARNYLHLLDEERRILSLPEPKATIDQCA